MKEYELKYGCNPNQKPARVFMENGADLPMEILNGRPGYINLLDAMNSWQLVREDPRRRSACARRLVQARQPNLSGHRPSDERKPKKGLLCR